MNEKLTYNKIKLWTRQHQNILKPLEESGVYYVKKEYLLEKFDTISDYYLSIYNWYIDRAERIVPRPKDAEYPVWLSTSDEMMLQPTENNVILELEVPMDKVVLTDSEKWGYVSNFWYLPKDKQDEIEFNEELKRLGIGDESELYMGHKGNFYSHLRSKITRSWERLFEKDVEITPITQATLWEIKKEWIINLIKV